MNKIGKISLEKSNNSVSATTTTTVPTSKMTSSSNNTGASFVNKESDNRFPENPRTG